MRRLLSALLAFATRPRLSAGRAECITAEELNRLVAMLEQRVTALGSRLDEVELAMLDRLKAVHEETKASRAETRELTEQLRADVARETELEATIKAAVEKPT